MSLHCPNDDRELQWMTFMDGHRFCCPDCGWPPVQSGPPAEVWTVFHGNVGQVFEGTDSVEAHRAFNRTVEASRSGSGRGAWEPVTLFKDGSVVSSFEPDNMWELVAYDKHDELSEFVEALSFAAQRGRPFFRQVETASDQAAIICSSEPWDQETAQWFWNRWDEECGE